MQKSIIKEQQLLIHTLNAAKLNLGQISLIFKDYEEAEKYFMECIENDDEEIQAEAYYYLSKIKLINNESNLGNSVCKYCTRNRTKPYRKNGKGYIFCSNFGKTKNKRK